MGETPDRCGRRARRTSSSDGRGGCVNVGCWRRRGCTRASATSPRTPGAPRPALGQSIRILEMSSASSPACRRRSERAGAARGPGDGSGPRDQQATSHSIHSRRWPRDCHRARACAASSSSFEASPARLSTCARTTPHGASQWQGPADQSWRSPDGIVPVAFDPRARTSQRSRATQSAVSTRTPSGR